MAKLTLNDVANLLDYPTSTTTINNNWAAIEAAVEKTLSRDGTSPNQMTASLDMNSNQIINLPYPGSAQSPVRLMDVITSGSGVGIPSGGLVNNVLAKTSGVDYEVEWKANTGTGSVVLATSPTIASPIINSPVLGGTITGTVSTSSPVTITNATASITAATGALIVTGGVGVGGALYTNGLISTSRSQSGAVSNPSPPILLGSYYNSNASGNPVTHIALYGTTWGFGVRLGGVTYAAGSGDGHYWYVNGNTINTPALTLSSAGVLAVTATTASTSSTIGALTVAGGLGVAGAINGANFIYNTTALSTYIGYLAGNAQTNTTTNSTAVGYQALKTANAAAINNTALGYNTLRDLTHASGNEGVNNTALGAGALQSLTTGYNNVAVGIAMHAGVVTGNSNMGIGSYALQYLTSGASNVAIGTNSMGGNVTIGTGNVAIGTQTGYTSTGNYNTSIGHVTGYGLTSGANNIIIGANPNANKGPTSGSGNILIGYDLDIMSPTSSNQLNIGGVIQGTVLGTLASQVVTIPGTLASTTTTTGAFVVAGGVGIAGALHLGAGFFPGSGTYSSGVAQIYKDATLGVVMSAVAGSSYDFYLSGRSGTGVIAIPQNTNNVVVGVSTASVVSMLGTTASTSTTTGALTIAGGVGIAGAVYVGGNLYVTNGIHTYVTTAPPAGGTANVGVRMGSSNHGIFYGSGYPTLSAANGSLYIRSDGSSTTTRAYVNTDGSTTWTYLTAGA